MSKMRHVPSAVLAIFAAACSSGSGSAAHDGGGQTDGAVRDTGLHVAHFDSGHDSGKDAGVHAVKLDSGSKADSTVADAGVDAPRATDAAGDSSDAAFVDAPPVSISPAATTVLTCSRTLFTTSWTTTHPGNTVSYSATAGTITGFDDPDAGRQEGVAWFKAPGSVDASPVTITAKVRSNVDEIIGKATATVQLIDPEPQAGSTPTATGVAGSSAVYPSAYNHAMSSSGNVVYAALPAGDRSATIEVWRGDDGGTNWSHRAGGPPPIHAGAGGGGLQYVAIAVDAGDPKTVYVAFSFPDSTGLPFTFADDAGLSGELEYAGIGFMVSTDGGDTFKFAALASAPSIGPYLDIISPAPGTVVVLNSSNVDSANNIIFETWTDTTSGSALLAGRLTDDAEMCLEPDAGGSVHGCCSVNAETCQLTGYNVYTLPRAYGAYGVGRDGEVPKLFTDGKGAVCVAYIAQTPFSEPSEVAPVAQCSPDLGATWGAQIPFGPRVTYALDRLPIGALTPTGPADGGLATMALAWLGTDSSNNATVNVATLQTNPTSDAGPGGAAVTTVSTLPEGGLRLPPGGQTAVAVEGTAVVYYDSSGVLWLTYDVDAVTHDAGAEAGAFSQVVVDRSCDNGATWLGGQYVGTLGDQAAYPGLLPLSGTMGIFASWGNIPGAGHTNAVGDIFYRMTP